MFSIHRMEQRILQFRVNKERLARWHESTRAVLCKYAPDETAESPRTWAMWDVLRPHGEYLIAAFVADEDIKPEYDLLGSIGSLLYGKGLYSPSLRIEELAIELVGRAGDDESKVMADKLLNYGESLRVLDRDEEALKAFRQSIAIREKLDGEDSIRVADALNYEGLAQEALNHNDKAEACYRKAVAIYEAKGGEAERYDHAKVLSNLAPLVFRSDKSDEAEALLKKAYELTADTSSQKIKPQGAIIIRSKLAKVLAEKGDVDGASRLFDDAIKLVEWFPNESPFRKEFMELYATFLRDTHKLAEAKRLFDGSASAARPQPDGQGVEEIPERSLRGKLRIIESTARLEVADPADVDFRDMRKAVVDELRNPAPEPWNPIMVKGITVRDAEQLSFDFLFDTGTDATSVESDQSTARLLMDFFLSSMAIDEGNQWAASDGTMPRELHSSKLGNELYRQARMASAFITGAMVEDTPLRTAFVETVGKTDYETMCRSFDIEVETWITPGSAEVYTGDPVGEWARFGKAGVAQAYVTRNELKIYWQWHVLPKTGAAGKPVGEIVAVLDKAFGMHLAPALQKCVAGSRLFGRLRQIHLCMILGTWFKQTFRHHPSVAKFLETGNPNQFVPTVRTISSASKDPEGGVREIDVTATEAVWQRALDLNNKAVDLRKQGRAAEAEPMMREALRIDEQLRGPNDPKVAHRLNNLASLLAMMGKFDEAREHVQRAWSIKQQSGHDISSPRILFMRIVVALLESKPIGHYVGQLRTLVAMPEPADYANVMAIWDISSVIECLKPGLGEPNAQFLTAIAAVLNDRNKLPDLEKFPAWRDTASMPLD